MTSGQATIRLTMRDNLVQFRVVTSTGSAGDCYDNAMAESLFATLECELIDRRSFQTQTEARMAIFEYLEAWYNTRRLHSACVGGFRSEESATKARGHLEPSTVVVSDAVGCFAAAPPPPEGTSASVRAPPPGEAADRDAT